MRTGTFVRLTAALPRAFLLAVLISSIPGGGRLQAQEVRPIDTSTEVFGWFLYLGVASNVLLQWDPDTGGYRDTFTTIDKQLHAAVGYGLTHAAITAGVRPRDAVIGVSLAAVGWELSQDFFSWRDVTVSVAGSLAAWGWHEYWTRRGAPETRRSSHPGVVRGPRPCLPTRACLRLR